MLHSKIEGEGQPLVILHGFLGMSDNWKTLGSLWAQEGFEVHMLDMRNHGRSFHSEIFSYEAMAKDVVEYCENHFLTNIHLLGHSMGGKTAMLLVHLYPHLAEKLIIADIAPKYYAPHHQDILRGLNAIDFTTKPSRSDVENTLGDYIKDFGTRQFLLKSLYWKEPGQLAFRFNLEVFNDEIHQIGKALPEETCFNSPTLFIRGEKSDYITPSDFATIEKHFPNSEIKSIPNAGHWLHAENPALFSEYVLTFLKQ